MNTLGILVTAALFALFAFTIYYQLVVRLLHIELRAREIHTVLTPDGWRIRLFRYRKGGSSGEPVLLVHGYTANHWNLTLPLGASITDHLAEQGYDCWVIDLRGNRTSLPPPGTPRHRATYDGYAMEDLPAAISFIRQTTGYDQLHWIGHSMGGMLLYAYELAHGRAQLASGATIGSPPWLEPYWGRREDRLVRFMETAPHLFDILKRAFAPIYAWLKPAYPMIPLQWSNLDPSFGVAAFFNAVGQSPGPVTRTFEECAKHRYLAVDNDRVNVLQGLNRLETPLMVVACPLDPIAPVSNLRAFFDRLPSKDKRFVELSKAAGCKTDYSHVDPPFARNAAQEVFAPITDWIREHPARRTQPRVASASARATTLIPAIASASTLPPESAPGPIADAPAPALASTSWGTALKNAAAVLSDLGPGQIADAAAPGAVRPRARTAKKPSATSRAAKPGAPVPSSAKMKVPAKAKKTAVVTAAKTSKPAQSRDSRKPAKRCSIESALEDSRKPAPRKLSTKSKSGRKRAPNDSD